MAKRIFDPKKHVGSLISKEYYKDLLLFRNALETECDNFFRKLGAPKVDLFLISNSISSPIASGSDSKPIEFRLDKNKYFLADSSQFGMEPLLFSFDMVYCYLPSFRGEDPDSRHLTQFFHCEAEMRHSYKVAMRIAENLIKHLIKIALIDSNKRIYFPQIAKSRILARIIDSKFPRITFKLLESRGYKKLIKYNKFGRILTSEAEKMIIYLVSNNKLPVWVTNFDRDVVAFYQAPDPRDPARVLNADLLVPPLSENGFGGEILGLGQRQNNIAEMANSIKRQHIKNAENYKWYLELRKHSKYRTTSGFGMGIERFVSWILKLENLFDACLYPVLKGIKTPY